MEYDPERALWRPGRRSFLFLLGGAMAGTMVPGWPAVPERCGIGDSFFIDATTRTIRYVGPPDGPGYTVLEFHRWLQAMADQPEARPGQIDITFPNPSVRLTDDLIVLSSCTLDTDALGHLHGGVVGVSEWTPLKL